MNTNTLFLGACTLILLGIVLSEPSYAAGGFVLLWIGLSLR